MARKTIARTTKPLSPAPAPNKADSAQPATPKRAVAVAMALRPTASTPPGTVNVSFALPFGGNAKPVSLCDEFNGWSPGATPMKRHDGGHWETTVALAPGSYEYLGPLRSFLERAFAGAHVFEVAYGTGYGPEITAWPASPVGAADINEEALPIARFKPMDPRNVTFGRGDPCVLPSVPRRFKGGLAGSWWSQVPMASLHSFLAGFHRIFARSAKVVFIDNAYVEGGSSPLWRNHRSGGTYQICKMDHGSIHEMLKDFPTESELRAAVDGLAMEGRAESLRYYWILSYVLKTDALPGFRADGLPGFDTTAKASLLRSEPRQGRPWLTHR